MAKTDSMAPTALAVELKDTDTGQVWGQLMLQSKHFATGSKGFYASTKVANPQNPDARYQCNFQMILIGSKEENPGPAE
jgi:hypothetical protein